MHIYIIADMEGHPACFSRDASFTGTMEWKKACRMLSEDIFSFSLGLFEKYSCSVSVLDFHRNAFNIIPPANRKSFYKVCNGYAAGKTFPLGIDLNRKECAAVLWGMHAPASTDGFLAHTISSRVNSIKINGREYSEPELLIELFAENNIPVVLVQGENILSEIMKNRYPDIPFIDFNRSANISEERKKIIRKALKTDFNFNDKKRDSAEILNLELDIRDGENIAERWNTGFINGKISAEKKNFTSMFACLIYLIFLRPFIARAPGFFMFFFNLYNRIKRFFLIRIKKSVMDIQK